MQSGRYFEDFEPGQTFSHWPGRTITDADDIWFSLLTQNQNPLHIDAHYAAGREPHRKPLVNGTLVFSIAVGQTVSDISLNAVANLDYEEVKHEGPVFHGDSIYTTSTISGHAADLARRPRRCQGGNDRQEPAGGTRAQFSPQCTAALLPD